MTALGAGDDAEVLLARLLVGREHRADAGGIGRYRLLREDVFPGSHCRLEVNGTESGRRRQDNHVDVRGENFLVGVEAGVDPVAGDLEAGLVPRGEGRILAGLLVERDTRLLDAVGTQIAERGDLDALGGHEDIGDRAGATSSGADHAHLDARASLSVNAARKHHRGRRRGGHFDESPPARR